MGEYGIQNIRDCGLYEVGSLVLLGPKKNRVLAANISQPGTGGQRISDKRVKGEPGDVHLNVLDPHACAGDHLHNEVIEFFINAGQSPLILHLKDRKKGSVEKIEMPPPSKEKIYAFRAKHGVPHLIENPNLVPITLIIIVDRDCPEDMIDAQVYPE